jgi:thiopeptide-type bacteriocin biosynthesis protein
MKSAGAFFLRSPLSSFPQGQFELKKFFLEPQNQEALFLASAEFYEKALTWLRGDATKDADKIEATLLKYYLRMSFRCTPFGLFSGVSWGHFSDSSELEFCSPTDFKKKTRLDNELFTDMINILNQAPVIRSAVRFFLNDTLYHTQSDIRFVESVLESGFRRYRLTKVANTDHLFKVIEKAKHGTTVSELVGMLTDAEITTAQAEKFINDLIDKTILISELEPGPTGADHLKGIIQTLARIEGPSATLQFLQDIQDHLHRLNESPVGTPVKDYLSITNAVKKWDDSIVDQHTSVVQVDLFKSMNKCRLNKSILKELKEATAVLHHLMPLPKNQHLEQFRLNFSRRYGAQEVLLLEAMDPSIGVGYLTDAIVLPEPLDINDAGGKETTEGFSADWNRIINERLIESIQKGTPLEISDKLAPPCLPQDFMTSSFSVSSSVLAKNTTELDAGNYQLIYDGCYGPGAALTINRFGYGDDELQQHIKSMIAHEEAMNPDLIFAEILHIPQPRFGNFLQRLPSYSYELPVLSRSSKPDSFIIPLQDLMVSVNSEKIVLTSLKHKKEVVPRLTTAHNFKKSDVPLYVFLCDLQRQDVKWPLRWNWGHLSGLSYLPRVTYGKVILAKARWWLFDNSIEEKKDNVGQIRELALQKKLPLLITISDGESRLFLDLKDDRCCKLLYQQIKRNKKVLVEESIFHGENLLLQGSQGGITNELLVPFLGQRPRDPAISISKRSADVGRDFIPGSEWLSINLYCDIESADSILLEAIAPLTKKLYQEKRITRWFYIRYNDPDFHLRIRLTVRDDSHQFVMMALNQAISVFQEAKVVWKIQYDTYSREIERYGDNNIENSENLFCRDSIYSAKLLQLIAGDSKFRFNVTLVSVDEYLTAFGLDLNAKDSFVVKLRDHYAHRFFSGDEEVIKALSKSWSKAFHNRRSKIAEVFSGSTDNSNYKSLHTILSDRRDKLTPIIRYINELYDKRLLSMPREKLLSSYIHMHVNRVLQHKQRIQEIIVYDFLHLYYRSQKLNAPGYQAPSSS